jgi:hypothetical protein
MPKKKAVVYQTKVPKGYMLYESAKLVLAERVRPENVEEYLSHIEPTTLRDGRIIYRKKDVYASEGNGKPERMVGYEAAVILYVSKLHVMRGRAIEYLREVPLRINVATNERMFRESELERKLRILTNDLRRRGGEEDEDMGNFRQE